MHNAGAAPRFDYARVERWEDLPAADPRAIDVAVLDMNHGKPNVGHDAIVAMLRERLGAVLRGPAKA